MALKQGAERLGLKETYGAPDRKRSKSEVEEINRKIQVLTDEGYGKKYNNVQCVLISK